MSLVYDLIYINMSKMFLFKINNDGFNNIK